MREEGQDKTPEQGKDGSGAGEGGDEPMSQPQPQAAGFRSNRKLKVLSCPFYFLFYFF